MLRRLSPEQPDGFAFTPKNREWAEAQMTKYPQGRRQSAIIPILWRAQEQEGWLSRPAIEYCADLLDLPYIRALEVATFYFMFQLKPIGSVANIQICGTTTCMICGAEALIEVCCTRTPEQLRAGKACWEGRSDKALFDYLGSELGHEYRHLNILLLKILKGERPWDEAVDDARAAQHV